MSRPSRNPTTVYLDPRVARAAKKRAAATGKSLSDLTNEGLTLLLSEQERILRIFEERQGEPTRDYDEFVKELRRDGLL